MKLQCHLLECRSENKYFNCTPQSDVMESLFTLTSLLIYTNSTRTRLQYFCKFKDSPARHREGLLCPIHEPTQWRPGEIHLMMNKTDRSNYISLLAVFVHSISYSCSCSGFLKLSGLWHQTLSPLSCSVVCYWICDGAIFKFPQGITPDLFLRWVNHVDTMWTQFAKYYQNFQTVWHWSYRNKESSHTTKKNKDRLCLLCQRQILISLSLCSKPDNSLIVKHLCLVGAVITVHWTTASVIC